jgi:hypothetical protein
MAGMRHEVRCRPNSRHGQANAATSPTTSFVIDGEGVILKPDSVSDFDRLHSRRHDSEVQLLGFDFLELDGADLRQQPFETPGCAREPAARSHAGIQLVEHVKAEHGGIVFDHACRRSDRVPNVSSGGAIDEGRLDHRMVIGGM